MLLQSILVAATTALSLAPSLAAATPIVTRHDDGSVEFSDYVLDDENKLVKREVQLYGWQGCTEDQKFQIESSWKQMLDMADKIKDKVNFHEQVAVDYLGNPQHNQDKQADIAKMIDSVATWQIGSFLPWQLKMVCNDPVRIRRTRGAEFPEGCPKGTPREDWLKCNSLCWMALKDADGNLVRWVTSSMAYTENWKHDTGMIAFCPGFFDKPTCPDALHKYGNAQGELKWNMVNYQCREQIMVHELFHIDQGWIHHAPATGHITDRKIRIKNYDGTIMVKNAYGPLYTKVLARWSKDVGHYVITNADNLAFYFLGKWIQEHAGFYPSSPIPDIAPIGIESKKRRLQKRDDVWDPLYVVDGELQLGDKNDLATALGAESPDAAADVFTTDQSDYVTCSDFVANDEADSENSHPMCANDAVDNDANAPVELDLSRDPQQIIGDPKVPPPIDVPEDPKVPPPTDVPEDPKVQPIAV